MSLMEFPRNVVPLGPADQDPWNDILYAQMTRADPPGMRRVTRPQITTSHHLPGSWRLAWYPEDPGIYPDCVHKAGPEDMDVDRACQEIATDSSYHGRVTSNPFCPLVGNKLMQSQRHVNTLTRLWYLLEGDTKPEVSDWLVYRRVLLKGLWNQVSDIYPISAVTPDFYLYPRPDPLVYTDYPFNWYPLDGPPSLIMEVTEDVTAFFDYGVKVSLYARMGVAEYWILDPHCQETPPLHGWKLIPEGIYKPIEPLADGSVWPPRVLQGIWFLQNNLLTLIKRDRIPV